MREAHLASEGGVHSLQKAVFVDGGHAERQRVEHGAPAAADFGETIVDVENASGDGKTRAQFVLVEWLGQTIIGAGFEREQVIEAIGVRYQEQQVGVVRVVARSQLPADLNSIYSREPKIENGEPRGVFFLEYGPGAFAVDDENRIESVRRLRHCTESSDTSVRVQLQELSWQREGVLRIKFIYRQKFRRA